MLGFVVFRMKCWGRGCRFSEARATFWDLQGSQDLSRVCRD